LTIPNNDFAIGDGGVFSNLDDFLNWDQNFYNNEIGQLGLIESIEKPKVDFNENKMSYASGLMIMNYKGQKLILHGGGDVGIRTGYFRFPDLNFSVIAMANTNEYDFFNTPLRIADVYLAESLIEKPPQNKKQDAPIQKISEINLTDEELKEYTGYYYSEEIDYFIEIFYEEGKLKMPDTNARGLLSVIVIEKNYLQVGPGKAQFQRNLLGNITGFSFDLDGERVIGIFYEKQN